MAREGFHILKLPLRRRIRAKLEGAPVGKIAKF